MEGPSYLPRLRLVAEVLKAVEGPIYVATHVDPDGDAVGSSLGLYRALKALGKPVHLVLNPPRYLGFLLQEGEATPALEALPQGATLVVLDSADPSRVAGVPLGGFIVNIDHHGTNAHFGHLAVVVPEKAATAQLVKELLDLLGVEWTVEIATPILTGILTDTGNFRFSNTTPEVLRVAADLLERGVPLAEITDRLQFHPLPYYRVLAQVLQTLTPHFGGLLVTAHLPEGVELAEEDSDAFVGAIRYVEGSVVAVYLRRRAQGVKVSIRSRGGVSAQNIALALGGGGHFAAAGANLEGLGLEGAYPLVLRAVEEELRRAGYL